MKAPLEHLESSTPMSAGEGGVYMLLACALIGVGVAIGWTKATLVKQHSELVERRAGGSGNSRSRRDAARNSKN